MHVLIVETGKHKGKQVKLAEREVIVGRDEKSGLRIASNEVSRNHCVLISQEDGLLVRDLGSQNGTFVNGAPISIDTLLQPGDQLVIGPMGFRVQSGKTARLKPRRISRSAVDESLSDDDVAALLSEGDAVSSGDTAIIDTTGVLRSQPAAPIPTRKRVFHSVAEEAADIIRRHQQSLAEQESAE